MHVGAYPRWITGLMAFGTLVVPCPLIGANGDAKSILEATTTGEERLSVVGGEFLMRH